MNTASHRKRRRNKEGIMLILPAVVILLVTFLVPLLYSFLISLSDSESVIGSRLEFNGLKNYISVLKNSRFQQAFWHTCFFVLVTITIEFLIGFVISLLLNCEVGGFRIFKLLFSVPLMVAPVVSGLLWKWMFADQYGLINYLISFLGIDPPLWFASSTTSWVTIIVANLWLAVPFVILVLLAGLGGLSEDLNEAARIDGANGRQVFFRIMLPQFKPAILTILVIRLTDAFRIYDLVYILTGGGPGGRTEVLSTYIYKATFTDWKFGEGAAASFLVMLIISIVSYICNRLMTGKENQ